ncbi:MAG TPA: T9SS type A sorting domain-containing protein, partial [Flavisolibacter sp.]
PVTSGCALTNAQPVRISIRNSANTALNNIPVKYRVNNGAWVNETIASIAANETIQYTFTGTSNLSAIGNYTIQAVVDFSADSFHENDTVSKTVINSPVITVFPYLEGFENDNGSWYAGGKNSSWEYGTPQSNKITRAANGTKAWKTRLKGSYNDKEFSYLYSPCYNISGMANPTLSFSLALDLEDCGNSFCDGAWVEYSEDGVTWTKLGSEGQGTNWYNKAADQLWSTQNFTRWHVATTALPAGLSKLRLRFVMESDPAANREGIAIDDIHIYDRTYEIYDGITMAAPETKTIAGNSQVDFTSNNQLVASILPNNQLMGATAVQAFINTGAVRNTGSQYYHDRNITIKPTNTLLGDSVTVRFYFLETEVDTLIKATGCAGCDKPGSAYELGISQYSDPQDDFENGSIGDNNQGMWHFMESHLVNKVPYGKGYYAEFRVKEFSEFWLNAGVLSGSSALPVKLLDFTAQKTGDNATLKWKTGSENDVDKYDVEVARGNDALQSASFSKLGEAVSQGNTTETRNYEFIDTEADKTGPRYYRLKIINQDGSFFYSPVRSVVFDDVTLWQVFPNPSSRKFNLAYQLNANETIHARVVDAKGRVLKEYRKPGNGFMQKLELDLSMFANGVYVLQVDAAGKSFRFKLYKQ